MKKRYVFYIILPLFFSCIGNENEKSKHLIGKWYFESSYYEKRNFTVHYSPCLSYRILIFKDDSVNIIHQGIYNSKDLKYTREISSFKYEVFDSILVFRKEKNRNDTFYIKKNKDDTLQLRRSDFEYKYVKSDCYYLNDFNLKKIRYINFNTDFNSKVDVYELSGTKIFKTTFENNDTVFYEAVVDSSYFKQLNKNVRYLNFKNLKLYYNDYNSYIDNVYKVILSDGTKEITVPFRGKIKDPTLYSLTKLILYSKKIVYKKTLKKHVPNWQLQKPIFEKEFPPFLEGWKKNK